MGNKKEYTAPSGTTYVQKNDSVYDWVNGSASGQIQLNPNSGGPTGYYYPAANRYDFNPKETLSQDYVNRHVRNIQQGLDSNGFIAPPTHWDNFRNWVGNGLIKLDKRVTSSDANGGTINYLDLFKQKQK